MSSTGPQERSWEPGDALELHPFSLFLCFPPPGAFRQRKNVFLPLFVSACLSSLNAISPGPATQNSSHCLQLIDKTCSTACCAHWHFGASQQSTLSISACVQGLWWVRPAWAVVDTVYSLVTLVAFSFGNPLLRWLFVLHYALMIETYRGEVILVNFPCKRRFTPLASELEMEMFGRQMNGWACRLEHRFLVTTGLDALKTTCSGF